MKVVIISYFFPPCATGAATVMYNLCKYLPKTSFDVITTERELAIYLGTYDREYKLDCRTIRLPVSTSTMFARFKFFVLAVFAGFSLIKKGRIDCVFAVYPYFTDLVAGYVLHRLTGKPFVIYMHDLYSEVRKNARAYKAWLFLERRILSSASTVLVMNEKYVKHYLKRGIDNLTIFPPSINLSETEYCESSVTSKDENEGKLKIVFTGSVYKAHEDAVLAFLEAVKTVEGVQVLFATPNKGLTNNLKYLLKEVNIGFLPKKKCIKLQRSADVLFLPLSSNSPYPEEVEVAFPCKLLEYLAAGKPVLAVVPEGSFVESFIREHEVGIAISELSIEKIIEAIEELKDEEKRRRYGGNALETAEFFDAKTQSKRLLSILKSIIARYQ